MKLLWWISAVLCSLVIVKPDIIERGLLENAISDVSRLGILNIQEFTWTLELVNDFYKDHVMKPFFPQLLQSLINEKSFALLVKSTVDKTRRHILELREKYAKDVTENSFHASDSLSAFQRERTLFDKLVIK